MTRNELDEILHQCYSVEIFPEEAAELIWGQFFEGETERITKMDEAKPADLVTETASLPTPQRVECDGHCRGDARCTGVISEVKINYSSGLFGHYQFCHPAIVSYQRDGYIVEVGNLAT
jgi:hypothetical protein